MNHLFKFFFLSCLLISLFTVQISNSFAYENQQSSSQIQLMEESIPQYDITTPEGRKKAAMEALTYIIFPPEWVFTKFIIQQGWNNFVPGNVTAKEIEEQRRTAVDIIRAGKQSDVDELKIIISEKAGLGLDTEIEGVPIEFIFGNSGNMILKVKYKT